MTTPAFSHRSCYVNCAEHLQNAWNVNLMYPNAPGRWSDADWARFLTEIRAFGYNCFEFWIPPTLMPPSAARSETAREVRRIMGLVHDQGLRFKPLISINCFGAQWYFACPNDPEDRAMIFEVWNFWTRALSGADMFCLFPGDPGGCNRNGCDHNAFLELCAALSERILGNSPSSEIEIGTWGTPFTGWGGDMRRVPNWDGTWKMLTDPEYETPEVPVHIWNGSPERAETCMRDLLAYLPKLPERALYSVNQGFNPDCDPAPGYDGRPWAREIARTRRVTSWDYSLSEGELINYPHWRLPRMCRKRLEEYRLGYSGGMNYTMTPKLNQLSLYAGGQLFLNPERSPDELAREFTHLVFGDAEIGSLMEAFEIVKGWGHYPRRTYSREQSQKAFSELIDRLEACKNAPCALPLFPDSETYRQDLLWHARNFLELTGDNPDRARIRAEYWKRALSIYDVIPMSADQRAALAADGYAAIGG